MDGHVMLYCRTPLLGTPGGDDEHPFLIVGSNNGHGVPLGSKALFPPLESVRILGVLTGLGAWTPPMVLKGCLLGEMPGP